ncbi:MAG: FHA domain-containing protein [Chroococcales cyanobacterium]
MEIEQRLRLYQVFLKLYEHNRSLLDEILNLENADSSNLSRTAARYVTGVVQDDQVYLITNLVRGKTQQLFQQQNIWIIGRGSDLTLSIPDQRLSRRHAVIQYIPSKGFYLHDLNSTNGSYINHELVQGRVLLNDGDRIRLGSVVFSFFYCEVAKDVAEVPPEVLLEINTPTLPHQETLPCVKETHSKDPETSIFLKDQGSLNELPPSCSPQISPAKQSEILDRFFNRQTQDPTKNAR